MRAEWRTGVELVTAILSAAHDDLARECEPLPLWADWVPAEDRVDARAGVMLIDDREHTESRNAQRWEGMVLYWTPMGFVEARRDEEIYRCWPQGECNPSYDIITRERRIGIREAVRQYGAARITSALLSAIERAAKGHTESADKATEQAKRYAAALCALRGAGGAK
jgi:hypothetical protein